MTVKGGPVEGVTTVVEVLGVGVGLEEVRGIEGEVREEDGVKDVDNVELVVVSVVEPEVEVIIVVDVSVDGIDATRVLAMPYCTLQISYYSWCWSSRLAQGRRS